MATSLNSAVSATDVGYGNVVQCLRKRITYLDNNKVVTVGKIPPGASIVGGGVHVVTAFDDTGNDFLDIGFIGSTTDADAYATDLTLAGIGYIVLDDLGTTNNIQGIVEHTITATYAGANSNATAGVADVMVFFVTAYPSA